ncbi:nucleotide sugar dehydrogenase [Pelagicoccus sp. SDUM812002]|uniref:nucleotide sugar dehydrogenase n=1 Tax=Pelagicoccus sp. SDUM812002 TaxID=3041266 RepID=UPI00280C4FBC|nr:nucleotide sugar dehydrogenase [Pelagicoccus sp. SDUM812002]MDQ8186296.1 nucleotide sugar dehydrogenase [Pelagicoccus sp. SDUM812002]
MTKIAIIGLGYVGLPLSIRFCESNVQVLGLDVDQSKVDKLNAGKSYIKHIDSEQITSITQSNQFEATTNFSRIEEVTAAIICVPTPLNKYREPDLSYVLDTGRAIAPHLSKGNPNKLVVLESTTYPGTTEDELRPILEEGSGLTAGEGFYLAYSPEREDPGRTDHGVKTIPKVMGGYTQNCLDRCVALYTKAIDAVHPVPSCRVAEATKLTENIFRSVNIALVNELKVVYERMGIDVWEVINAAATKPFGYMPFYPGPGLGGHCIPIDPFYLTWKAREYDQHTRFIELAGEINANMPNYVIARVAEALNERSQSVNGSRILLLGIAYKPNVDDDRESPSYALMGKLESMGAQVEYNDPHVPFIRPSREHSRFAGRKSVPILDNYDCILVATNHEIYKKTDFSHFRCPIVDTRNCISPRPANYYKA